MVLAALRGHSSISISRLVGPLVGGSLVYEGKWSDAVRVFLAYAAFAGLYWAFFWGTPKMAQLAWQNARRIGANRRAVRFLRAAERVADKAATWCEKALKPLGFTTRWAFAIALMWYLATSVRQIQDVPVPQLSLGALGSAVIGIWLFAIAVRWLFSSDVDYRAWGLTACCIGILTLTGLFFAFKYGLL